MHKSVRKYLWHCKNTKIIHIHGQVVGTYIFFGHDNEELILDNDFPCELDASGMNIATHNAFKKPVNIIIQDLLIKLDFLNVKRDLTIRNRNELKEK